MWFKKKKKVTFNIEINEINNYISENYVPDENEKQIKFQAKKKAEAELVDDSPGINRLLQIKE